MGNNKPIGRDIDTIENRSSEISIEEKARIFDLACEKYIEARDQHVGEWINKGWSSPQEYMGYAVYKELIDMNAIEFHCSEQQKLA